MNSKLTLAQRVNILRASVMGANDGIISVAGIVVGVAGASASNYGIFISGIAGMLAGTVSMAMGEYVSVSTQKDSEKQAVAEEKSRLKLNYEHEFELVKQNYLAQGIRPDLAQKATEEMMQKDPLVTTVRERYGLNINELIDPYAAAIASMVSFPTGSLLPMLAITLFPEKIKIIATFIAVLLALALTGLGAAILSKADKKQGIIRNVISGTLTMAVTYLIGKIIGG